MSAAQSMNAAALLLERGEPRRIALICGSESLRYDALRQAVARAAGAWQGIGVARGQPVAIRLGDGIDTVVAYLGAIWAGAVAVAVNPRSPADEWQRVCAEARWACVIDENGAAQGLSGPVLSRAQWRQWAQAALPIAPEPMAPDEPACWSYSSGSSGLPKAVLHAQRFALQVERVAAERLGVQSEDRLFASSRLFFVYPLANSLFAGLKLGASVILDPAWPSAVEAMACITRQRPSVFFSVPSLFRSLLQQGFAEQLAVSGIRLAVSAGEALPVRLRDSWCEQTGIALVNGYGASETMCLVLLDSGVGLQAAPGVTLAWADPRQGQSPGRVLIEAPTLALGYWQRPAAQAEHFRGTAFCPGDLFEHSGDGCWHFAGREDAMLKVAGRWVDLAALEEHLAQAGSGVQEAAAVAVLDADGVAAIALFYVARGAASEHAEAALGALLQGLPAHRRPHWLHRVSTLPRTETGKLLRRELAQLHDMRLSEPGLA